VPLPDRLARINRQVTNPIMRTFAGRVPGFAIVVHRGRRTGREYYTPVNAFRSPGGFVIALTYGPDRDWVRNVLAAGGCTLKWQGRRRRLDHPTVRQDDDVLLLVPLLVRPMLRLLRVSGALTLDDVGVSVGQ
jgi:deazaflavin-dependent oxidoreductase (nitroreductase family)